MNPGFGFVSTEERKIMMQMFINLPDLQQQDSQTKKQPKQARILSLFPTEACVDSRNFGRIEERQVCTGLRDSERRYCVQRALANIIFDWRGRYSQYLMPSFVQILSSLSRQTSFMLFFLQTTFRTDSPVLLSLHQLRQWYSRKTS